LDSQGGTFVNGAKITGKVALYDGDRLRLGRSTTLKFSLVDAVEESAMLTLFELTLRDPLTRIYNRRYFDRRLHEEFSFARRQQTALSLLLVDIDHFKRVNDKHGHPVGDMVLELVAGSIQKVTRPEDVLARYGGEEFVVIARGASAENAAALAERIRRHVLALSVSLPGAIIHVTASVGVATLSADVPYASCEELVVAVDDAMYQAKSLGRNRVCRAQRGAPPGTSPG
jgi:diguanylate cyclase (GGDEF)-like protein